MDKSSQPLVSVCLASYNQSKYVIDTLESIHKQTYQNIEIIIVDDFSTDDSVSVIDEWLDVRGNRFTNYQFVKNLMNKGLCATFNSCINNSTGKYISIFASDDIMLEHKTDRQVEILENTSDDVAMVFGDCSLMKEDGSPRYGLFIQNCRQFIDIPSGKIFDDLILGNFIPAMSTLIKRSIVDRIGKFDEDLKYEDWDYWLRVSKHYEVIFSNFIACKYRMHSKSLSNKTTWEIEDINILKKYASESPYAKRRLIENVLHIYHRHERKVILKSIEKVVGLSRVIRVVYLLGKYHIPRNVGMFLLRFIIPSSLYRIVRHQNL